jgi:hypothetical protein
MFQNMKVSTRLFMGFGIVILIMAGIVVTSVTQMNVMDTAVNNVNRSSQNIESALRILDGINSMRRFQLSALASAGAERGRNSTRQLHGAGSPQDRGGRVKFQRRAETKNGHRHAGQTLRRMQKEQEAHQPRQGRQGEEMKR